MKLGWKPKKKTDKGHVIVDEKVLSEIKNIPEAKLINEFLMLQKELPKFPPGLKLLRKMGEYMVK